MKAKLEATIKERNGNCGCMNEYEECSQCEHAGEKVEIEDPLVTVLNASDDTEIECHLADNHDYLLFIKKRNLCNWEVCYVKDWG